VTDIGSTLREARMRSQIDISEVELRTKIRAKYLRALENEEWDMLPGPVYIKSFLRTYGDYLGVDSRMLVDDYKRRFERLSDHDLRPIATLSRDRERAARGPLLPSWAIIGGVVVALVVALGVVGSLTNNNNTSATHTVSTPAHTTTVTGHRHRARPITPTTVKLELTPTAQVYVCLVDGTGRKLIPGIIYAPGQTIPAQTAAKMLLTLGNASVQMRVGGKLINVQPSSNAIRYLVGPGTPAVRKISLTASPRCP
jgi:cytoskeleton protein RodZ